MITALLWLPSLRVPFVWDDWDIVGEQLRALRDHSFLWRHGGGYFRPVTTLTFALDWAVWYRRPWGYHLTNLLLHAANSALVCALLGELGCPPGAALAGGLLFAAHPVHAESVAWVAGRTDLVCCLFFLLSLLGLAVWLREGDRRGLALGMAFALFALGGKEVGAALALVLPAWALSWRRPRAAAAALTAALLLGTLVAWLRWPALGGMVLPALGAWGPWEVAQRALRAHWFYLQRLFAPLGLSVFVGELPRGRWVVPASGAALLALGWWLARAVRRGRPREALAGSVWLFGLAPSLAVVLGCLAVTLVADRYLYVPSLALCLALPPALWPRRAGRAALWGAIALLAALSLGRQRVWADPERLWREAVERNPGVALPKQHLALVLAERGRPEEAAALLRRALCDPWQAAWGTQGQGRWERLRALSALDLGGLCRRLGDARRARRWLLASLRFWPHWGAYYQLALLELEGPGPPSRRRLLRAWALLQAALGIYEAPEARWALARVCLALGARRAARRHLWRVVEADPRAELARRAAGLLARLGP